MKRFFALALAATLICTAALSMQSFMGNDKKVKTDSQGHVLVDLWQSFDKAYSSDKPQTSIEILDQIIAKAKKDRLSWDFYEAASRKRDIGGNINWKIRDSLESSLSEEIDAYGEPIVSLRFRNLHDNSAFTFIKENAQKLESSRNESFYDERFYYNYHDVMKDVLSSLIRNDYEYALWREIHWNKEDLADRNSAWIGEEIKMLTDKVEGRYYESRYLEFLTICAISQEDAKVSGLKQFAEAEKGKVMSLFALAELAEMEMSGLNEKDASSEEFKALYDKCLGWEKERKSYTSGTDGAIAKRLFTFGSLIQTLKESDLSIEAKGDSLEVLFRNLGSTKITISQEDAKGAVRNIKVTNPTNSFYKWDTVFVALPKMDDGEYQIKGTFGASFKTGNTFTKNSLSIAMRDDSEGKKIFVADAMSGKPEEKIDLELFQNGKSVAKVQGMSIDGFTILPEEITGALSRNRTSFLVASCRRADGAYRKSKEIICGNSWYRTSSPIRRLDLRSELFTDKTAFNPGETVKYKAVFYKVVTDGLEVFDEGMDVTARLIDSEGKEVAKTGLTTNEFGSAAGEFEIPKGLRNGMFYIQVSTSGAEASRWISVDEFILPSYEMTFDKTDKTYFPGDTVVVSGRLSSYSGHSLSAAKIAYSVMSSVFRGEGSSEEGSLTVGEDGAFSFSFPTGGNSGFYNVTVKVTDATGETQEFSTGFLVIDGISLSVKMTDACTGSARTAGTSRQGQTLMFSGDTKSLTLSCKDLYEGKLVKHAQISYELKDPDGKVVSTGVAESGKEFSLQFEKSGEYVLSYSTGVTRPDGKVIAAEETARLLRIDDDAAVLDAGYENIFKLVGPCSKGTLEQGERICMQVGTGNGEAWILLELFGDHRNLIERRIIHLEGKAGEKGSLEKVEFIPDSSWGEGAFISAFYFKNGTKYNFTKMFRTVRKAYEMPLSFSTFSDKALPGTTCRISLDGQAGSEAVAAVFDKSSESFASNIWSRVARPVGEIEAVNISSAAGRGLEIKFPYELGVTMVKSAARSNAKVMADVEMAAEAPIPSANGEAWLSYEADGVEEEAMANDEAVEEDENAVAVRSDFSTSLAFEPFLRPDKDGKFSFEFQTSDKLSTFVVQVYAHDKEMHDALLRREMVVTMPVKVNVVEPKYLYKGDSYVLHATVSSETDEDISGTVSLNLYPSADREGSKAYSKASRNVVIPAKGSVPVEFEINTKDHDEVGILVSFTESGKKYSDAVFVSAPVFEATQTITEAHSAVLLSGKDKDALLKKLQKEFTGTTHKGAEYSERNIRQMVLDAIPSKFDPVGKDVISLTETFYVRKVAESLGATVSAEMSDEKLLSQITACRNADGGYGWFQGMKSSPSITAVILERLASLRSLGIKSADFGTEAAVKFLDNCQFTYDDEVPYWRGYLSTEQYLHVRSLYSDVPFSLAKGVADKKSFKEFKKYVADYLVPSASDGRGMQGQILAKARRLSTLDNLLEAPSGKDLAAAWGIKFDTSGKLKKSFEADVVSLIEYAVGHPDGGWYYPNAVMPWRGLLESELYAHTILCKLMSGDLSKGVSTGASFPAPEEIANGVRLWMMLQKETQNWDSDPAYVDAVGAILAGGDEVLDTKVITLTKTYRKPFREIVAAGNGFTIERQFFKEVSEDGSKKTKVAVEPGTVLHVGDKVIAEYRIWSQENRSFVKLTVPREAAFRPVQQISGNYGWWLSPVGGRYSIVPQGYRNVKSDVTEYYFDVYPEEKTSVSEEFYVTQEGVFSAPAVTIESLYAPHYRANGAHSEPVVSKTAQ